MSSFSTLAFKAIKYFLAAFHWSKWKQLFGRWDSDFKRYFLTKRYLLSRYISVHGAIFDLPILRFSDNKKAVGFDNKGITHFFLLKFDKYSWFCLQFWNPSNCQIWKNGRKGCHDVNQQVTMLSPPLNHLKNIYEFIFIFLTPATTKLDNLQCYKSSKNSFCRIRV